MSIEQDELLAWLRASRQHVLSTFDGLDDQDARRAVLRSVVGGEQGLVLGPGDGAWSVPSELTVGEVLETYLWNADIADRAILTRSLDDPPALPRDSGTGGPRLPHRPRDRAPGAGGDDDARRPPRRRA